MSCKQSFQYIGVRGHVPITIYYLNFVSTTFKNVFMKNPCNTERGYGTPVCEQDPAYKAALCWSFKMKLWYPCLVLSRTGLFQLPYVAHSQRGSALDDHLNPLMLGWYPVQCLLRLYSFVPAVASLQIKHRGFGPTLQHCNVGGAGLRGRTKRIK